MQRQITVLGVSCVVVLVCAVGMAHAQRLSIRESFPGGADLVVVAAEPAVAKEVKLTDEQTALTKKLLASVPAQKLKVSDEQYRELEIASRELHKEVAAGKNVHDKTNEIVAQILSDEQKKKWKEMTGKPPSKEYLAEIRAVNAEDAEDAEKILQRRVGTWITETTSKKAWWTPEESTTKGEEKVRWILDKRVLLTEGWAQPNDEKATGLMVYDQQTKQYRLWWFDNKGVFPRSDTTGKWDAESETMIFRSDLGNGNRQTMNLVFTNKDRFDWIMTIQNQDGRLMMDMVGHTVRKK